MATFLAVWLGSTAFFGGWQYAINEKQLHKKIDWTPRYNEHYPTSAWEFR